MNMNSWHAISDCWSSRSQHHRRSAGPHLRILPSGKQEIRAGKNLVLTCRAQVPNIELIKHLRWINPRGQEIPQDDRLVPLLFSDNHLDLIIKMHFEIICTRCLKISEFWLTFCSSGKIDERNLIFWEASKEPCTSLCLHSIF